VTGAVSNTALTGTIPRCIREAGSDGSGCFDSVRPASDARGPLMLRVSRMKRVTTCALAGIATSLDLESAVPNDVQQAGTLKEVCLQRPD